MNPIQEINNDYVAVIINNNLEQIQINNVFNLGPPPPLTRMYTNAHLPPDEPEDESNEFDMPEGIQYVSISRINTNADEPENQLLVALSEAESKMYDEYEEAFFKELEHQKQSKGQDQDQDQDK